MSSDAEALLSDAARSPKGREIVVVVQEAEGSSSSRHSSEEVETTDDKQKPTNPPPPLAQLSPRQLEKQPARDPLPVPASSPAPADDDARKGAGVEKDAPNTPKWGGRRLKGLILSDSSFWAFEPTSASPPRIKQPTTPTGAADASDRLSRFHLHESPDRDRHAPKTSQIDQQHTSSVLPDQLELDVRIGSMRNVLFPTRFSQWHAADDARTKPRTDRRLVEGRQE